MKNRQDIRNIAIIAHVDHGKTSLVDQLLRQSGVFRENQQVEDRVMDSNDIERERGITILSKNTAVSYKGIKINIVDTPGHADFGGEVERVLKMVDGVLLLVDAFEGPMPQTRFVLSKALELGHPVIVVVNKIDRPDARPKEVVDEVLELLIDLDADEEQLDCPFVFASAKEGRASLDVNHPGQDMAPLFETILEYIPGPKGDSQAPLQMLVSTVDYNDYVGRIAIGKIERGQINVGQEALLCNYGGGEYSKVKITNLYLFNGLQRVQAHHAEAGDIVAVSGVEGINIGDTICDVEYPEPLPFVKISQPTISMTFSVNTSPFAGQDGKYVTSRNLRDRLFKEVYSDVSLKVEETDSPDAFRVSGRGELHLSVLIETMRREAYEFCVSKPEPILQETADGITEPYEHLIIDVPQSNLGSVMELIGERKGEMTDMIQLGEDRLRVHFQIPARGLIGFSSVFLTETRGYGIMHHSFSHYGIWAGAISQRQSGSLVAWEDGIATAYALQNLEERGELFISPGTPVYAGMIVGEHNRAGDLEVNVARKKHVTNMRAAGSDDLIKLTPPRQLSLEEALAYLAKDEYLEVTPKALRLRKAILDRHAREKVKKSNQI